MSRRRAARAATAAALALLLAGCGNMLQRLGDVGGPPRMTPSADPTKAPGYQPVSLPMPPLPLAQSHADSLWQGGRAFFPDQRAQRVGDIVTVVVNINDAANIIDNTTAQQNANQGLAIPAMPPLTAIFPHALGKTTPTNLSSLANANANEGTASTSNTVGTGQIQRSEAVTISLAGVVTQVLPNGNLAVVARQEVRVNSELRILQVSGIVRPQDIASDNTVPHDRMAEARISYGGRGELVDLQAPRYGQQLFNILLPF